MNRLVRNEWLRLQAARDSLLKIRKNLRPYDPPQTYVSSPVDLSTIVAKIGVCKHSQPSSLQPEEVILLVDDAISKWIKSGILCLDFDSFHTAYWRRDQVFSPDANENTIPFITYLHETFASKRVIHEYRWCALELQQALLVTEQILFRGKMGIYQQVGTIASQSITEPTTTMTLTTFYTAGLKSGATQDIKRMGEIMNLLGTEGMAYPCMECPMNLEFCQCVGLSPKEVARQVSQRIPGVWFHDLLVKRDEDPLTIFHHNTEGFPPEDEEFLTSYRELCGEGSWNVIQPAPDLDRGIEWQWSLRFQLNKDLCVRRGLTPETIALRLIDVNYHNPDHFNVLCSHPLEEKWIIYLQPGLPLSPKPFPSQQEQHLFLTNLRHRLWLFAQRLLQTVLMDGLPSIKDAKLVRHRMTKSKPKGKDEGEDEEEEEDDWEHKAEKKEDEGKYIYLVETHGSDLGALWYYPEIDWASATSNSIQDVLQEIGLDAAQVTISEQMTSVLRHNNLPVDERHINLMAAMITHFGTAQPLTRFGFIDKQPLERITFEEPFPNLLNEALHARIDYLKGIIENILLGNTLPFGINRLPKPINVNQEIPSIQNRLHLLEKKLQTERRHIPRVWPKVSDRLVQMLNERILEALPLQPAPDKIARFFKLRLQVVAGELQTKGDKEGQLIVDKEKSRKERELLRFTSTMFGFWLLSSYEWIWSEYGYAPRTYAYQIRHALQPPLPLTKEVEAVQAQQVKKPKYNIVEITAGQHGMECKPVEPFQISHESWSYLPTFRPSSADFGKLTKTQKIDVAPAAPPSCSSACLILPPSLASFEPSNFNDNSSNGNKKLKKGEFIQSLPRYLGMPLSSSLPEINLL